MRNLLIWFILAPFLMTLVFNVLNRPHNVAQISYSRFLEEVNKGNVKQVVLEGNDIYGAFKSPISVQGPMQSNEKPINVKGKCQVSE